MARYFVYGYYGFGNFGDDLLLDVMLSRIRQHDPDAEFIIRARAPIAAFAADDKVRFLLAEPILEQRSSRLSRFRRYRNLLAEQARRCDVLVIGGGTLFIDKGRFNWSLLFLHETVRSAKQAGRQVIVTGVAIDILAHPFSLWLTRRIFALADFTAVRDSLSLAYFPDWSVPPKLAADLAWLKSLQPLLRPAHLRKVVGLNFIDYYRSTIQSDAGHVAYQARLRQLIEHHRDTCDFQLIALQKGIGQRDDWFTDEFLQLVPKGRIIYVTDEQSLRDALESVDAVVTTRFHLALLAARQAVPTCIVDHELKLTALAQELFIPTVSLLEFILTESVDPIKRLNAWDAHATSEAVSRMTERAKMNFAWMLQ